MSQQTQTQRQMQPPTENSLVHFEIPAKDAAKLSKFYQGLFGWKFQKWDGPMEYWMIETGPQGQSVGGGMFPKSTAPKPEQATGRNFYYTSNIDRSIKKAQDLGAKVLQPKTEIPGQGWSALLADPEGNAFGFFQGAANR